MFVGGGGTGVFVGGGGTGVFVGGVVGRGENTAVYVALSFTTNA